MKRILPLALAATLFTALFASSAHAQVSATNAWVRATVPHQQATGAFMQLQSASATSLVSASSPLTPNVEVHEMSMEGEVMRMRQVPAIALPAGKAVELKPGGYHIMFLNLKQQVREGDTVPLTLVFRDQAGKSESLQLKVPVRGLAAGAPQASAGHGHGHP